MRFDAASFQALAAFARWTAIGLAAPFVLRWLYLAGRSIYDDVYQRRRDLAHDRLTLAHIEQQNRVHAVRHISPDENGRLGVTFDGVTYKNMDTGEAFTQLATLYLDPMRTQIDAIHRMMIAMRGVPAGAVERLPEAAAPLTAPAWPSRVPLSGLLDESPSYHRLILGVTVGENGQNEIVQADLGDLVHVAVGGSSGWGKSVFLRAIAYQLALSNEPVDLALIDLEGATLAPFAQSDRLLWPLADTEQDAAAILGALTGEIERRKVLYTAFPGADSLNAYNRRADDPLSPLVCIIDEATALLGNKAVAHSLRTCALRARKYGIWLLLAGQDWKSSSLDSAIRNQLSARVQFKAQDGPQSRVLLGRPDAEQITDKGRCYAWLPGRELVEIQAPWISHADIATALAGNGPQRDMPDDGRDQAQRIKALAASGASKRQIALTVFGYAGGAAFNKVSACLEKESA